MKEEKLQHKGHILISDSVPQSENDYLKSQQRLLLTQLQESQQRVRNAESQLYSTNEKLVKAELRLQKEQLNKTYLEAHKLDLMSEVAELRNRLQSVENERAEYRDKYEQLRSQVADLQENLIKREREVGELQIKLRKNETINKDDNDATGNQLVAMKNTLCDLLAANDEKDRKIEELRKAVATYQRVEEIILTTHHSRRILDDGESMPSTMDRTMRSSFNESRNGSPPPVNALLTLADVAYPSGNPQFSTISGTPAPKKALSVQRSNSYDASKFNRIIVNETPMKTGTKGSSTSLPRDYNNHVNGGGQSIDSKKDRDPTDLIDEEDGIQEHKKKNGFLRFLAKLRRNSSHEGVHEEHGAFKRGGVRSTAGPRLGWSHDIKYKSENFDFPFAKWDADQVATWLHDLGLSMYVTECRRWCKSGQHMLSATQNEIEKELRIHNPLHKKKLRLALEGLKSGNRKEQLILNLRPDWIAKWLDDVGLPQYKDKFYEARIDGRMLNFLTVDDLLYMKITNALHHASIRRGIELLRKHNFNLSALKRRPSVKSASDASDIKNSTLSDPTLWSNHRVIEWLRAIDLSEYAANLRGSGVHGALMVLEPRFTVEHLANILNIPNSKTLLRRHLHAHFVNLVGNEVQAKKREMEDIPGMALTLNMKVKGKRTSLFKRGRPSSEYICPMESGFSEVVHKTEDKRIKEAVALYKKELNKRESKKELETIPANAGNGTAES